MRVFARKSQRSANESMLTRIARLKSRSHDSIKRYVAFTWLCVIIEANWNLKLTHGGDAPCMRRVHKAGTKSHAILNNCS